uniref:Uncharacterized protein n=1 Tax=Setaria italica TaxID=4555 RepID=K3XNY0_SETIT
MTASLLASTAAARIDLRPYHMWMQAEEGWGRQPASSRAARISSMQVAEGREAREGAEWQKLKLPIFCTISAMTFIN